MSDTELTQQLEAAQQRVRQLERQLVEAKAFNDTLELLALVASKTNNAVIITDAAGHVEWINDGFVRIAGYELPEVRGKPLAEVFYGPDSDRTEQAREITEALRAGRGVSQELKHRTKDGRGYWASISVTPVFNEEGKALRWIGIANDITRRRHAQEELERAKNAAEAANRAKSEFLANMSHEIRTPMNAIIGMTELALGSDLTPPQRDYLTTVKESAESLLRLLNDILDLSKIEARKLEIETGEFDLYELVGDTVKPYVVQAARKKLRLDWRIDSRVPAGLLGDHDRLRQILVNLLDNALKFTEHGTISMSIDVQWQTAEDVGLVFSVHDTGIGIPANKLKRIFEAFTQADSSITRRYGGTGLGLTISAQLIELMGGKMSVESSVDHGSMFQFVLRFALPKEHRVASPEVFSLDCVRVRRQLRVLVADDNPANRVLAARILEKRGHEVVQVTDGREAVLAVTREPFHVVLMDVQMPEMDGFSSTSAIREQERLTGRSHLPIIAMTAYAMRGDRERCLAAGMDAYIAKPLRSEELVTLVEGWGAQSDEPSPPVSLPAVPPGRFAEALSRVEGDEEILREQMEFFLRDAPSLADAVHESLAARNADGLVRSAHRLKSLAGGLDGVEATANAQLLEEIGRGHGSWSDADLAGQRLSAGLDSLRTEVESYLASNRLV